MLDNVYGMPDLGYHDETDLDEFLEGESEEMDDDELLKAVQREIQLASDNNAKQDFETAVRYFDAEEPGPIAFGQDDDDEEGMYDDLVSADVRNAVEDTLAEILPGFYGDSPVHFVPLGPGDEARADQETKIINHVFLVACKGYTVINRAFKDALIRKNAVARVTWEVTKKATGSRTMDVTPDVVPMFQNMSKAVPNEDGTFTIDTKDVQVTASPKVEWVPVNQLLVDPDHDDITLDTARFVGHRKRVRASDIVAAGIDKEIVDELSDSDGTEYNINGSDGSTDTGHRSNRNIVVCESYYRIDTDDDGIAELIRVVTGGGPAGDQKLLWREPVDDQPFACGVAFFAAEGWRGISLEERLRNIQIVRTDMIRQILDAGWRNLNQRLGIQERMVNPHDIMTSRRGGIIRLKDPNAIVPIPDVQLPSQVFNMIQLMDQMRRESGGGAIDTAPQAQQFGADSAHGIERIMSAIEQSNAMVAKNLAETFVSQVYIKLHRVIRRKWPSVIQVPAQKDWLQSVPAEWAERNSTDVVVGLSQGARIRQAGNLKEIMAFQAQDMQSGMDGTMVTQSNMYNTRMEFLRQSGVKNPEKYWQDPMSPEGQQAAQQKQQAAQQAAQQQQEQVREQAMLQSKAMQAVEAIKGEFSRQVAKLKEETDRYKADLAHIQKTVDQRLKLIELNAKFDQEEVPNAVNAGDDNAKS